MASSPSFTATVSAITDAFGDPTRRSIYLFARDHSDPRRAPDVAGEPVDIGVTASMVAAEVGVHANVARHHLDKLAAGGYLEVISGRSGRRCRPSLQALRRRRRCRADQRCRLPRAQ